MVAVSGIAEEQREGPDLAVDPEDPEAIREHALKVAQAHLAAAPPERKEGLEAGLGTLLDTLGLVGLVEQPRHFLDLIAPTLLFRIRGISPQMRVRQIERYLVAQGVTEAMVVAAGFPANQVRAVSIGIWLKKRLADPRYQIYLLDPEERVRRGRPTSKPVRKDPPPVQPIRPEDLAGLDPDQVREVMALPEHRQQARARRLQQELYLQRRKAGRMAEQIAQSVEVARHLLSAGLGATGNVVPFQGSPALPASQPALQAQPVQPQVSRPVAQPAMPAARETPPPTKMTTEEADRAEYESMTEDQRRHIDSLPADKRSAAIQTYRSDRITREKADREIADREAMRRNAMAKIMGGSPKS